MFRFHRFCSKSSWELIFAISTLWFTEPFINERVIDSVNSFSFFFMILAQSTISRSFHSRSLMQFYTKLAPKETSLLQIGFIYTVWNHRWARVLGQGGCVHRGVSKEKICGRLRRPKFFSTGVWKFFFCGGFY